MKVVPVKFLLFTFVLISVFSARAKADTTNCQVKCSGWRTKTADVTCEYQINPNFGSGGFRLPATYDCNGSGSVGTSYGGGEFGESFASFCQKLGCPIYADSPNGSAEDPSLPGFLESCVQDLRPTCTKGN